MTSSFDGTAGVLVVVLFWAVWAKSCVLTSNAAVTATVRRRVVGVWL